MKVLLIILLILVLIVAGDFAYLYFNGMSGMSNTTEPKEGQTEGTTNHDIQPLIVDEIAQIIREVAAERSYTLIDIHALTAQHPEWFTKDSVHPSSEGAAAIAQEVYAVINSK